MFFINFWNVVTLFFCVLINTIKKSINIIKSHWVDLLLWKIFLLVIIVVPYDIYLKWGM